MSLSLLSPKPLDLVVPLPADHDGPVGGIGPHADPFALSEMTHPVEVVLGQKLVVQHAVRERESGE